MEWWNYAIAIVLGIALGVILNKRKNRNYDAIHVISKDDFYTNMRKGQLVDIRKEEEYNENKIKGAKNFSPRQLTTKFSKVRKDQSVYLYCNNGKKSYQVAKNMTKHGYTAIYVLEHGLDQK